MHQIGWPRGLDQHLSVAVRTDESEALRMQGLAPEPSQRLTQSLAGTTRKFQATAIQRIPHDWKADVRQMHADLVGTAGFQAQIEHAVMAEALAHPIVGHGRPAILAHGLAQPVTRVPANGGVDTVTGNDGALDHGDVFAPQLTPLQRRDQGRMRGQGSGNQERTGGVLVQTMHQTGTRQQGQGGIMVQQGIDQGTPRLAGAGMHGQAWRLVHDQAGGILVQQLECDRLAIILALGLQHDVENESLAANQALAGFADTALQTQCPGANPFGQAAA